MIPGLTKHVLKNLIMPSATRRYPDRIRDPFAGFRGRLYTDVSQCKLCGKCARTCPTECLTVDKEARLWQRDPFSCLLCGACVDACPVGCLRFRPQHMQPHFERFSVLHIKKRGENP